VADNAYFQTFRVKDRGFGGILKQKIHSDSDSWEGRALSSLVVLPFGNVSTVVENIRAESASANHAKTAKSLKGNTNGFSHTFIQRAGE
jgi:hypothetical protein